MIVDAVGVTKPKKSDTRMLERKPSVSLKNLMMNVALGARDEDTRTSLANRIIRLNSQMTVSERKAFTETVGISAGNLAEQYIQVQKEAIAETVNYNFMRWTLKRNVGAVHFSEEQMKCLRLIKDHSKEFHFALYVLLAICRNLLHYVLTVFEKLKAA